MDFPAWDDALGVLITALAAVILVVAVAAYRRTPTRRLAFFAAAFGLYFLKGAFAAAESLFFEENALLNAAELVAEASALMLFVLGLLRS